MTTTEIQGALRTHESAVWADFENTVAEIVRDETRDRSVTVGLIVVRVANALKTRLGRIPNREECHYLVEVIYGAYGLDPLTGYPAEPTPDQVRDQEDTDELAWMRENDSHDSSRARAAGV